MIHENQEYGATANTKEGIMVGMVKGGLAGADEALLLAPQSGKDTRRQIQEKSIELRDRTTEMVEDTVAQVRTKANDLAVSLKDRGQEIAVKQLDHISGAAQAEKKAIQDS
jgi:gas vesicle protein